MGMEVEIKDSSSIPGFKVKSVKELIPCGSRKEKERASRFQTVANPNS